MFGIYLYMFYGIPMNCLGMSLYCLDRYRGLVYLRYNGLCYLVCLYLELVCLLPMELFTWVVSSWRATMAGVQIARRHGCAILAPAGAEKRLRL